MSKTITEITIKNKIYQLKDIPETYYLCPVCDYDTENRICLATINETSCGPSGGSYWQEIHECLDCNVIFQFNNSN